MEILEVITRQIVYFGGGLCFLMSLEQVFTKNRSIVNVLSALLLFSNGIIVFGLATLSQDDFFKDPILLFLLPTAVSAAGPLNLFYYSGLVRPSNIEIRKYLLYFLPTCVFFIMELVFHYQPYAVKVSLLHGAFIGLSLNPITAVFSICVFINQCFLSYLVYIEFNLLKENLYKEEFIVSTLWNTAAIIAGIIGVLAFFLQARPLFLIAGLVVAVIHVTIFIEHTRFPGFFQLMHNIILEKRYKHSTLKGIDSEMI
jgi:hypothetical protein